MDLRSTLEQRKERILQLLRNGGESTIVLVGDTGMGKTWMAREISKCAIEHKLCYATLWVSVTEEFDTKLLYRSIARQLSLTSITEESKDEEEISEHKEVDELALKKLLRSKLKEERPKRREENKYLLLVLDDIAGNRMRENKLRDQVLQGLRAVLPSIDCSCLKLMITRRKIEESRIEGQATWKVVNLEPLSEQESLILLRERVDKDISKNKFYESHFQAVAKKSMGLPAAIIMIAETLNYIKQHGSGAWTLGSAIEEAGNYQNASEGVNPLVFCACDMLQDAVLKNCFWYSVTFFHEYGTIHYNNLITYWILEGYFDPFEHIEEAYEKGHHVLMALIDRGMLKIQEGNMIVLEGEALKMFDCCPQVFSGTESLRLPTAFQKCDGGAQGRITLMDGMIKTLCNPKSRKEVSTLLIDGSRLCREVHETFFNPMKGLEVLAIFNPLIKSLTFSSFKMEKLRVLVLRDCDLLEEITHIQNLENLTVLEISGASRLKSIPDEQFDGMTRSLRSLNLSGLRIESLPPSFYRLRELHLLILRGCSCLKELQSLKEFVRLQRLDLSGTNIQQLPDLPAKKKNKKLLPGLQILDLSGTKTFSHFQDKSIENLSKLRVLNLSKTSISKLPSIPCNLFELNLSGCSELLELPSTTALKNLELLDVSNTPKLAEIENKSFEHLTNLCSLNLSNTKVKNLTWLSNLPKLRQLILRDCLFLENMPEMEGYKKLEVLDLQGCSALMVQGNLSFKHMSRVRELNLDRCNAKLLTEIAAESLEHMTDLQILKLSGIATELSSFSKLTSLTNLRELSLKNFQGVKVLPSLDDLSKLEVLDLSGSTALQSLPPLGKLSNLRKLLLSGCSSLQVLPSLNSLVCLKVLDLSKTRMKEISREISLLRPGLKVITEVGEENTAGLPEDVNSGHSWFFKPSEVRSKGKKPLILVNNAKHFQLFEQIPELQKACLKLISFPICPPNEQARDKENSSGNDEVMFSNIYFRTKQIPCDKNDVQFLEIRGFDSFPAGLKHILKHTEYISLTENRYMKSLSELEVDSLMKMKGCWLERCGEMNSIFCEKKDGKLSQKLKILWVSNLPNLNSLYGENIKLMNFQNLTHLHLDCCPKLETVFTTSHYPRNLEILEIKFCDKLMTVFKENKRDKPTLSKLRILLLLGLPALTTFGASTPHLVNPKTERCPSLNLSEIISTKDDRAAVSANYGSCRSPHVPSGLTRSNSM